MYNGTNSYAVFPSPRGSGAEATLVTASWLSHSGEDTLNLRGVSTVLALAAFLRGMRMYEIPHASDIDLFVPSDYSLWAKDFIFVISDGYLDGMQAFITTYYGEEPSSKPYCLIELTETYYVVPRSCRGTS